MANYVRKIIAMLLAISLGIGMGLQAFAAEAKIGETEYDTLGAAVGAANSAEGPVEIDLVSDVKLGNKLDIKNDITIDGGATYDADGNMLTGGHTIERTENYNGTMFEVKDGGVLTLDGDVVIDGGNNWTFDSEQYFADMLACLTEKANSENPRSYNESEEGGNKSTAPLIKVNKGGKAVLDDATIQNNFADRVVKNEELGIKGYNNHNTGAVFSVAEGAEVVMNKGATIQHIRSSVFGQVSGKVTMNGGVIKDVFGENCNGGVIDLRNNGSMTINDGEITQVRVLGLNANGNGIVAQVYGTGAKLTMNGGYIHENASFSPGGGWGSVVYLNRGGQFTMTDGMIADTKSDICTAFVSNREDGKAELLGGTIVVDNNTGKAKLESFFCGDITIGEEMEIIGKEGATFAMYGEEGNILDIDGEVKGDGTMWLMTTEPITGEGTITSDVLVKFDKSYGIDNITLNGGNWNCLITVDSVGTDAVLNVESGATVENGLVRVLESVPSGDYREAEESNTAQASAFKTADGVEVKSPVRYYHRITADQNKGVVVTLDYNGGTDENGWSGCQITAEDMLAITEDNSLVPTIVSENGLVFAGWNFAEVLDPESLDMSGDVAYGGEEIGTTLRLIAQWKVKEEPKEEDPKEEEETDWREIIENIINDNQRPQTPEVPVVSETETIVDDNVPLADTPSVPADQYDVPSDTETIVDEDVPLADVPGLGDESAIWMLVAAFAIFGLVVINLPKRNREED